MARGDPRLRCGRAPATLERGHPRRDFGTGSRNQKPWRTLQVSLLSNALNSAMSGTARRDVQLLEPTLNRIRPRVAAAGRKLGQAQGQAERENRRGEAQQAVAEVQGGIGVEVGAQGPDLMKAVPDSGTWPGSTLGSEELDCLSFDEVQIPKEIRAKARPSLHRIRGDLKAAEKVFETERA